ncbi:uncharacterized protein F5147DRAFT_657815 [Suillus discolor]|uniref:Uncharacterized protein n=1 Tax=Suillus discolor TaxID=1912936 RepID=A0A9P7JN86_9AGAM|nr:uncharacterized protein F5147DRAFT_657815 [Suillus discolor]KAG2091990.1 hypothetical protein F5147DRAFT_657815 [Suillus discolor]
MSNDLPGNTPTAPQRGFSIYHLLSYFGLVVKLPLALNSSMNESLSDSSKWTTTPVNCQQHPVGEPQCNSAPNLTSQIVRRKIYPTLSGTYSDVWQSTWYDGKQKCDVAVKSLKIPFSNEDEKRKPAYA